MDTGHLDRRGGGREKLRSGRVGAKKCRGKRRSRTGQEEADGHTAGEIAGAVVCAISLPNWDVVGAVAVAAAGSGNGGEVAIGKNDFAPVGLRPGRS